MNIHLEARLRDNRIAGRRTAIVLESLIGSTYEEIIEEALALSRKMDWPVAFEWQVGTSTERYLLVPEDMYEEAVAAFRRMQTLMEKASKAAP